MNKELIEKIITYNYNEYGAEFGDALVDLKHENEWLHHIIKEVREYIKTKMEIRKNCKNVYSYDIRNDDYIKQVDKLLEILDKVEE